MEKWDEHYWSVLDDVLEDYSLQFEPKVEFIEKSFFFNEKQTHFVVVRRVQNLN